MTTAQAEELELSKLELQDDPWLSIDDIDFYDFSTHCIYLKEDIRSLFGSDTITVFSNVHGKPFVVIADGERCYLGSFYTLFSSWMPAGPTIRDIDLWMYPDDVIHIKQGSDFYVSFLDVRNDTRIACALKSREKYHEGLQIELNNVEVINRSDTSTVTYAFTVTNCDNDNLYVPDPDLMGSNLFHYYTYGISFVPKLCSAESALLYYSTNGIILENESQHIYFKDKTIKNIEHLNDWSVEWFTRIESNQSIHRTVTRKYYPSIRIGTYCCYFAYKGPTRIEKDKRILADGRLWLGEILSNVIEKSVSN